MIKKLLVVSLLFIFSQFASAETLEQSLAKCSSIQLESERLKCFDGLLNAKPKTSEKIQVSESPEQVSKYSKNETGQATQESTKPMAQEKPSKSKREALEKDNFGQEYKQKPDVVDQMLFTITAVKKNPYGQKKFIFSNGQIWQQKDYAPAGGFKAGMEISIKRGALNSFYLKKMNSNNSIKVKRIK